MYRRLFAVAAFVILVAFAPSAFAQGGTTSADILPSNTGQHLGNPDQRWSGYLHDFDMDGTFVKNGIVINPASTTAQNTWTAAQFDAALHTFAGGLNTKFVNGVPQADQFDGADACAKIAAAIAAVPATGGIVNASGFTGVQTCSSNPFAGVTKSGSLILGAATFQTTAQWKTPAGLKWRIVGMGRGDSGSHNTVIQAVSGFPTDGTAVVRIGGATSGTATHGTMLDSLTLDCNGIAKVGAFSADANEMSGLKRVDIANCSVAGFDFTSMAAVGGAQNYVVDEVEIYPLVFGVASTVCGKISGQASGPQQISNLTCVANSAAPSTNCFTVDNTASGRFTSIHGEYCGKVLNLGSSAAVDGITLDNTNGGPGTTTVIEINNAASQNIVALSTIKNGATNAIVNNASSKTFTDGKLALYYYGNGSAPRPECSSSAGGNSCLMANVAFAGNVNLNGNAILDGATISAATGMIRMGNVQAINFRNNANSADVNGVSKDTSDVVHVGGTAGISTAGPVNATAFKVSGVDLASGNLSDGASLSKISGTPTTNRAVCWKTASTLGYCSTVVAADGSCTCN